MTTEAPERVLTAPDVEEVETGGTEVEEQAGGAESAPPETAESLRDQLAQARIRQADLEKQLQRAKSIEGNQRTQRDRDTLLKQTARNQARIQYQIDLLLDRQLDPNADPAPFQEALAKIRREQQEEQGQSHDAEMAQELYDGILEEAEELEVDVTSDARFKEALASWGAAKDIRAVMAADRQFQKAFRLIHREQARGEASEESKTRVNQDRRDGNLRAPRGAPAGGGELGQTLVNRLAAGDYLSPSEMLQAKKARDSGVYPQRPTGR